MEKDEIKLPPDETAGIEPVAYDYDALRNTRTIPAIIAIYRILADNAASLVGNAKTTPEEGLKAQETVLQQIMTVLVQYEVTDNEMQYVLDGLQAPVYLMLTKLSSEKTKLEKEILAHMLDVKDPGTGEFAYGFADLGKLLKAREEMVLKSQAPKE